MKRRAKIFTWIGGIVFLIIILSSFTGLIVEYLWLDEVGYSGIFWKIKKTQFLLFFIALAIALLYTGVNVHLITKKLKTLYLNLGQGPGGSPSVVSLKPKVFKVILYVLAGIISLVFAFSWAAEWNEFFRFFHSQSFDTVDPVFGKDVSFYVFSLPLLESIQNSLIFLVFVVTVFSIAYHLASGHISLTKHHLQTGTTALKQIFTNIGIWFLLLAWGYYLDRFQILYKDNDIIYGAGYTDIHVLLPVFWIMGAASILMAVFAFIQTKRPQFKNFIKAALALFFIGIIGQGILPGLIQNYKVDPSQFSLEEPYIKNNIKYTRLAYNLDEVEVRSYNTSDTVKYNQIEAHKEAIKNVRIWDQNLTVDTYKQLQEIRLYYEFYNIDLDRYHTNEGYRQVLISARELTSDLPANAETWVNRRLQYTHGYGVVMSPSTQKTTEGSPIFYIQDIPPQSTMGLSVSQPAIYYGESGSGYKLVNTKISELDYPKGDKNVYTHYKGKGGVPIDGLFRQLLFSYQFSDINILLTDYIQEGSRIQFWRAVKKRVHKIAPFLNLDNDPYIVLSEGKLYWIQDAYTTASHYPYSAPYNRKNNYIRNSVKVVIDAYQGSVNFYISNPNDPVLQVYKEVFPKLFKPLDQMPGTLKQHIKYPKDLFEIQLEKFSVYHMVNPRVFYNQEDLWERPVETYGGRQIQMRPYYMLGILPDEQRLQYMLISPMTPKNRDNMISWIVVKSDFPGYGQIINYELPKEKLYLGPAQIEAKINQNTEISRQLSLWDQRGSKVIRGNLMVIPIENSFLYVEPVFLFSTNINIPQLKRVIATTGSKVVMEPSLQESILALYDKKPIIPAVADSLSLIPPTLLKGIGDQQLHKVKSTWKELQEALKAGDWEEFGQKMDRINQLLKESE